MVLVIFWCLDDLFFPYILQKKSRIQLTEDEMVAYFFTLDGKYFFHVLFLSEIGSKNETGWNSFSVIIMFGL